MPAANAPNALTIESYGKDDKVDLGLWGQSYQTDDGT